MERKIEGRKPEKKLESEKTRVSAKKPLLQMPFKNSISEIPPWNTSFPRAQGQDRAAAAGGQPLPDRAGEEQDGGREGQTGDRLHQERGGSAGHSIPSITEEVVGRLGYHHIVGGMLAYHHKGGDKLGYYHKGGGRLGYHHIRGGRLDTITLEVVG